ncbi:MAG: M48 family metalloprotease [Microscillaceae bacterium]|jgi:predicted Zn-dependent protease|nr:M48 family metalloprotease [Microscillaceae bacterium]
MKKTNFYKFVTLLSLLGTLLVNNSCAPGGQGAVNLFSVEQDIQFGKQLRDEIANNPKEYPLLDPAKYPRAYQILQNITNKILNSGAIEHRNDFEWKLHIIHDDKTLNAFVSPGGYIYVYTGLIKYLDKEDELAGVMGHEIAHADRRHSTTNMTKQYGLQVVLGAAMGQNPGMMKQILGGLTGKLVGLKFGRAAESDADAMSVQYLAKTDYNCAGTAGFFEKMMAQGGQQPPQWLSTHPSHENRVNDIYAKAKELGCKATPIANQNNYQELKRSLP